MRTAALTILLPPIAGASYVLGTNASVLAVSRGRTFSDVDQLPERQVAVVPGVSEWNAPGQPNLHFLIRMDATAEAFHRGKVTEIVVSGGHTEVEPMRDALIRRGVPAPAIGLDAGGVNTEATVRRARSHGPITLIGERFHMPRALFYARRHQVDAVAFSVTGDYRYLQTAWRRRRVPKYPPAQLREWAARTKAVTWAMRSAAVET